MTQSYRFFNTDILKEISTSFLLLGKIMLRNNVSGKVKMLTENCGTRSFSDAICQCGDSLTVNEENILVMPKTFSPVPDSETENTNDLQVSLRIIFTDCMQNDLFIIIIKL